jgi:hypothetical protein
MHEELDPAEDYDGTMFLDLCPMCDGGHGGSFCPLEDTADYSGEPWWAQ